MKKFAFLISLLLVLVFSLTGCVSDAAVASRNLSVAADQFQVTRRVVFYNGITDGYILVIEGKCSLGDEDVPGELSVTCKTGPNTFMKHFLGLSDNVTYFAEQLEDTPADVYHYTVVFKPEEIIPYIDLKISGQ